MTSGARIAVVGAGPAGLYTADDLVVQGGPDIAVDLIEALPVPYGLVRYGVAPDHPRIKGVIGTLAAILERPQIRFLGGLPIGGALSAADLRAGYDAVVYAVGAPLDRRLGVPGEDLPGAVSAASFVPWYNGHPHAPEPPDLVGSTAVVVGGGNVALDIARILVSPRAALAATDVPEAVLDRLTASGVRRVRVLIRRGPAESRFTAKELRELGNSDQWTMGVRGVTDDDLIPPPGADRNTVSNLKLFGGWRDGDTGTAGAARSITLEFRSRPVALRGGGRLKTVDVERSTPPGTTVERIATHLLVRSIGHLGRAVPGVPFDSAAGTAPHRAGRVVGTDPGPAGTPEYAVGWFKRGANGVIGTNKLDAMETVATLLADLADRPRRESRGPDARQLARSRGLAVVELPGWTALDRAEIELGRSLGRDRVKLTDLARMTALATAPADPVGV